MQEFLALYKNIENPTLEMVFFTFLMAFILSGVIAIVYVKTTPNSIRTANFVQSLILSSIGSTTIIQAIGDNVGVGLGMLGALSIINFRTSFRDPRDIIFMFACLGNGIACGVFGFYIAIFGSVIFCLIAILLSVTPYHLGRQTIWEIRFRGPKDLMNSELDQIMRDYCTLSQIDSLRNEMTKENVLFQEMDYKVILKSGVNHKKFIDILEAYGLTVKRINKQNEGFETE